MKKIFLAIFVMATWLNAAYGQREWKMQPVVLHTRWAKQVSPSHVLAEYPRPQLVRQQWENLNGLWDYAITEKDAPQPNNFNGKILVPYPIESALSGVQKSLLPNQNLWYKRTIKRPAIKDGWRTVLNFGAVDWQATVFVNDKEVGTHTGGYTAFSIDITDALKPGDNKLVIKVFDPTDAGINPHGKQTLNPQNIYYTPSSGIWQTVWMEMVPATAIQSLYMTPDIDKGLLVLRINTTSYKTGYDIEAIATANEKKVAEWHTNHNTVNNDIAVTNLKISKPHLWSPDDPFLYDLTVRIKKGNTVIDEVKSYFGMRKIAIQKDEKGIDRIFLNNKYTYNLGTLDQGFWPEGLYTAPTDEALTFDIKAIKAMGFNTIRKHIKVEPARWYYHADKTGMLVWQDLVNPDQQLKEGSKAAFERESKDILTQLHNYPSITTWVLFNEKWGQYDQERLTKWIKEIDPSRIVNGHSGEYLYINDRLRSPSPNAYVGADMTDVHSYPQPMISEKQAEKAQVCGEFGGIGVSVPGHQWNDLQGWGYVQATPKQLVNKYAIMVKRLKLLEAQGLSGSIYTEPFDVEGEENGMLTYDREIIKIPLRRLREINSELVPQTAGFDLNPKFVLARDIDSNDTDEKYETFVKEFDHGKNDSTFLRRVTLMAMRKKDIGKVLQLSKSYNEALKSKSFKDNIQFNNMVENFFNTSIENEINPVIFANGAKPDFVEIEKNIQSMYGSIGEVVVWKNAAFYYYLHKDYSNFVATKTKIHNKYPDAISIFDMNNDAWFLFQNVSDRSLLEVGLEWSKKVIESEPTANHYDTYAEILYKLGRTKEAIDIQEKGLKLPTGDGFIEEIKKNLEKMKANINTW